jgi:hypothetical protein
VGLKDVHLNSCSTEGDDFPIEFFKAFFSESDLSDNQDNSSRCFTTLIVLNVYFHYLTTPMMWTVFPGPWRVDEKGITYIRCSNYSSL